MNLDSLKEAVLGIGIEGRDTKTVAESQVKALRERVTACLADTQFIIDAIEKEIEVRDGEPGLGVFDEVAELGVRFSFCYWHPGQAAAPHEHSSWTVTGVVHGQLEVSTFDLDATIRARKVILKNTFSASAGAVGYIHRHSIHSPSNATANWAISFHVTNVDDRPILEQQYGRIAGLGFRRGGRTRGDSPLRAAVYAYERECVRRAQLDILRNCGVQATDAINRLCARGDLATRWRAGSSDVHAQPLMPSSTLVRRWPGVDFEVVAGDGIAELRAVSESEGRTLVRAPAALSAMLECVARSTSLVPADIPGAEPADQLKLARALVDWGFFTLSDP